LQAASFSESGGTNATTTIARPLLTTGAAGVSITGDTTITVNSTIDASAAATGAITLTASRNIVVNSGATIKTSGGAITLSANQQATPTSGSQFFGIVVSSATITSATGSILLQGKGGDLGSLNVGVLIQQATVVSSTGTGANAAPITILGSGGAGPNTGTQNDGGGVQNANTRVTSVDGAVSITGNAGSGTADRNIGVFISAGGTVSSTGTTSSAATLTIQGTGGAGTDQGDGVLIEGTNA